MLGSQTAWSNSLFCTLLNFQCVVEMEELVEREGLYFKKFSDNPFSGKVKGLITGKIKNGKWHGHYKEFYENGALLKKGAFLNGKEDGVWTTFDFSGIVTKKGMYKNGLKQGPWKDIIMYTYNSGNRFFNTEETSVSGNYINGERDGIWKQYCKVERSESELSLIREHNRECEKENKKTAGDRHFFECSKSEREFYLVECEVTYSMGEVLKEQHVSK